LQLRTLTLSHALPPSHVTTSSTCPASTLATDVYVTTVETYVVRTRLTARRCPTLTVHTDDTAPTASCTFDSSNCDERPYCVVRSIITAPCVTDTCCEPLVTVKAYKPCQTECVMDCSTSYEVKTVCPKAMSVGALDSGSMTADTLRNPIGHPSFASPPSGSVTFRLTSTLSFNPSAASIKPAVSTGNSCPTFTVHTTPTCPEYKTCPPADCIALGTVVMPTAREECGAVSTVTQRHVCNGECYHGCRTEWVTVKEATESTPVYR
jgi:hypothetical protein